ncbi:hypothetical protein K525DRAFT_271155 [Schizophyllum commune Loenen D]|nr:hypothetical protein K525DRAFT_271155 [Schizophyllum commune Loenen D]
MGIPGAKTASKEFRASIKEAIRLIKAGGLQRLLDAPPDKPLADFLGSLGCNEVCTQLYTLAMLADIVRRGHPALWVLPDPMDLYPRVFRWIACLLPLKRGFSMEYRSVNRDIMLELLDGSIGIFQHILSLPLDRARSALLSEGHDAIGDISLWKALGQTDDDNALIATFFLHKPTRLFKFIERQLHEANLRLARDDDTAWADATSFVIISTLLLLYRDLGMRLVPGGMVYSMTIFTRLAAAKRPHLSEICLRLLNILCANDSRALSTALTCGIFSLLAQLHAAHLCHEDSLTKLRGLISGALSFPKSVELFFAHAAMSNLVRQSWVLPEENELRELAERRQALLQVASQDWEANVRCCNPNCSYWKLHEQRCGLVIGELDPEIGALRARDAHFMEHIVKNYLRERWEEISAKVDVDRTKTVLLELDIPSKRGF